MGKLIPEWQSAALILIIIFSGSFLLHSEETDPYSVLYDKIENKATAVFSGREITNADILELTEIYEEATLSPYKELEARSRSVLFLANEQINDNDKVLPEILPEYTESALQENKKVFLDVGFYSSLTVGFLSLTAFNVFWQLSDIIYNEYVSQTSIDTAAALQYQMQFYDLVSYISAGTGIISFGLSSLFLFNQNREFEPAYKGINLTGSSVDAAHPEMKTELLLLQRDLQQIKYINTVKLERTADIWSKVFAGIGITAIAGIGYTSGLGFDLTNRFNRARYSSYAEELSNQINILNISILSAGITALTGFGTSFIINALSPDTGFVRGTIGEIDAKLLSLEEGNATRGDEHLIILEDERQRLFDQLEKEESSKTKNTIAGWSSFGVGIVGISGMVFCLIMGNQVFDTYNGTIYEETAQQYLAEMNMWNYIAFGSGALGVAGFSLASFFALFKPEPENTERTINLIKSDLKISIGEDRN